MHKTLIGGLFAIVSLFGVAQTAPAQENTKEFKGFLYEVLDAIGTEDESPIYYLEQFDGSDLLVIKRSSKKKEDPNLQEFIGKKVTIVGTPMGQSIDYYHIYKYEP